MRTTMAALLVLCGVKQAAADTLTETFDTDPIAGGRFSQFIISGSETTFTYNASTKALDAFLDLDNSQAGYVSNAFSALSDLMDSSFCVKFRVTDFVYGSPSLDPVGFLGLFANQHVGDFGSGLTVQVAVSSAGALRASARIDPVQGGSFAGSDVALSLQDTYLAVGAYTAATRRLSVDIYGGPGFGAFLGNSLVTLPTNRTFSVFRIGAQNGGRFIVDRPVGGLYVTIDDLATPCPVATPVPEPSVGALVLVASMLAGARRRRSRSS